MSNDRISVRLCALSNSALEIIKAETGLTPSRIIRNLLREGNLSLLKYDGSPVVSMTFRMDVASREKLDELREEYQIDTTEVVRRLLLVRVATLQLQSSTVVELTTRATAAAAFHYVIATRNTAVKYKACAAAATPGGLYYHEASVKAALLEKHADDWFQAIGRYLNETTEI